MSGKATIRSMHRGLLGQYQAVIMALRAQAPRKGEQHPLIDHAKDLRRKLQIRGIPIPR